MQEHVKKLRKAFRNSTFEEFDERIIKQSEFLKQQVRSGELENQDYTLGLELETYVTGKNGNVKEIPAEVLENAPVNPELGLHNLEINGDARKCDPEGFERLEEGLRRKVEEAREELEPYNLKFRLDSIWTQQPEAWKYLTETKEVEGFSFPPNMKHATRYHGLDNAILEKSGGSISFQVPGAKREMPSLLFESLATSIQPHLQIPETGKFPDYFNYSIRVMAPLLAVAANSPFLPKELYNSVEDEAKLVEETFHELRIPIFEQAVNTSDDYFGKKCRVPEDIEDLEEAIELIREDEIYYPELKQDTSVESFKDNFWELDYKHGTYWRWVRPVFGSREVENACDSKSVRIEFRPLPTQPTVEDNLSLLALTVGLIHGLVIEEHPVIDQEWLQAKKNFYNAVRNGIDAEIEWIDENGDAAGMETGLEESLEYARKGLKDFGFSEKKVSERMEPMENRIQQKISPAKWKIEQVEKSIRRDESLETALKNMQQKYFSISRESCFAEWIE